MARTSHALASRNTSKESSERISQESGTATRKTKDDLEAEGKAGFGQLRDIKNDQWTSPLAQLPARITLSYQQARVRTFLENTVVQHRTITTQLWNKQRKRTLRKTH